MASGAGASGAAVEVHEVDEEVRTHSAEAEEATKDSMASVTTVARWDTVRLSVGAEVLGRVVCV